MVDHYIRTGDQAVLLPAFTPAVVACPPMVMSGSASTVTAVAMNVCLEGDEANITFVGTYVTPSFPIPGACKVTITKLGGDQTSKKTKIMGKAPIVKGTVFDAKMEVSSAAKIVTPGGTVDDPVSSYTGKGQFVTTNTTVMDHG